MTIRRAAAADASVLARLNGFVHHLHVSFRPDHFKSANPSELAEWYKPVLEKPATRIWICEEGGVPVGYVMAVVREAQGSPGVRARRWLEIEQIAVDQNCRRRGIGRALVQRAVSDAGAERIDVMETSCWSFNDDAQAFFESVGFVAKSVRLQWTGGS